MDEAIPAATDPNNARSPDAGEGDQGVSRPHELERRLITDWPPEYWRDSHVVLAVSGGADSVALLRAMYALKASCGGAGTLYVAHLNHGLRGGEADADAAWLIELCGRLGLPVETATAKVASLAAQQGDGWEAAARTARYEFLRKSAERLGARFVATAHTADDQVETVLHRIMRGSGLAGLSSIPSHRPLSNGIVLVRPMLKMRRREIEEYLSALGQDYRVDDSNNDRRYTRNRVRHELLPLMRERFNAEVDDALLRLAGQAEESQQVIEALAAQLTAECVTVERVAGGDEHLVRRVKIDCTRLAGEPPIIVREVCKTAWRNANWPLQAMGFSKWQLLADMAADNCRQTTANLPGNISARRERRLLVLEGPDLP